MTLSTTHAATYQVSVAPSGRTFEASTGETLLAAGIRQGITLPYGCKDGACGSCKCTLLRGTVSHGQHSEAALSAVEEAAGQILTCCATAQSDLELESRQVTAQNAFPVRKMPTRVSSLKKVSNDVMLIALQLPANDNFQYHPGQYLDFLLRDGARRSYSMANAATSGAQLELHIRHLPGGKFTDHVFGAMQEKEILRIEGPFGSFYLREDSQSPIVFLASGTGLAPIKAILEKMDSAGIQRQATLYWGGRRPADLYLDAWVRNYAETHTWFTYVPVISNAQADDNWTGRTGLVHQSVLQDHPDLSNHQVYACGVPIMVASARRDFVLQGGLPEDAFFADAFVSQADQQMA